MFSFSSLAGTQRQSKRANRAQWGTATLFAIPAFLVVYAIIAVLWRTAALAGGCVQ